MSNPYIAQDILDQCRQALRDGKTLEHLAGRLHCDADHLARMLGLPALRPIPATDEADLWRTHEIDDVI